MTNPTKAIFVALAIRKSKFDRMNIGKIFDPDPDNLLATEIAEAEVAILASQEWDRNQSICPFDKFNHGIQPYEPCPVCGDYGDERGYNAPSNCRG